MAFRNACLIVNPASGQSRTLRHLLPRLLQNLQRRGIKAELLETSQEPGSASRLAVQAAVRHELVLACGGDGTVHEVLQGVAGTAATLGVLPFGTANALARNLGLSLNPCAALEQLLGFPSTRIPLGRAETSFGSRWFTVMAGAGPDGALVQQMNLAAKSVVGRRAYYTAAARLFCTQRFAPFQVDYRLRGEPVWRRSLAVAIMAARVADLGGLFRGLTPQARLHQPHLSVQLVTAPASLGLPAWFAFGKMDLSHRNPWLTTLAAEEVRCTALAGQNVYAQVDGEAAGVLPLTLKVVPDAVSLLMASSA